jgi:spore coat protein H
MITDRPPPVLRRDRNTRGWVLALALVLGGFAAWWWLGRDAGPALAGGPGLVPMAEKESSLFGLTKLHRVHVTMAPGEWEVLQRDTVVGGPGGRGGRGGAAAGLFGGFDPVEGDDNDYVRPSDGRTIHRGGGFGGVFPWVTADLESGDTHLPTVGLRYKGNASYTASVNQLRRNLKVKTDFFGKAAGLEGEKTLDFNAGALDGSRVRESLSYSVFRAAGVPAPRTAFVELTLTVPGLYDRENVGVYTLVEQVNKSFAKEFLPGKTGLLLKPERLNGGIAYYGEDWSGYESTYRPDRPATPAEQQRLIEFARLVARSGDAEFRRELGSYLDVEEFLRYVAVNALLVNLDSYLTGRHNFFLYLNPDDQRFLFIPWDQDLSLGSFGGRGGSGSVLDLSLLHPYSGQNRLIERTLAVPEHRKRYLDIIGELTTTAFSKESLLKSIDAIQATTQAALDREAAAVSERGERPGQTAGFGGMINRGISPRTFVDQRLASVQRQLARKSEGTPPGGGFGGPGGGGRGGPGGFGGRGGF